MSRPVVIALEVAALLWGTFTVCNPAVKDGWTAIAWFVSLFSTFGLLSASVSAKKPFVLRATAAGAFVFALVFACILLAIILRAL